MRRGGGKVKGGQFEREVANKLSLWVTHGKKKDCFWRSAMSGGRATVRGTDIRQAGDICAVAPEGHVLTDRWYIETKHVKDFGLWGLFDNREGRDSLFAYWSKASSNAHRWGKMPMLIAKQNGRPTLVCMPTGYLLMDNRIEVPRWNMTILPFETLLQQSFKPL